MPHRHPAGLSPDATYQQNGKAGVSPRVSLDVSRSQPARNRRVADFAYDLLVCSKRLATLTFQNPHFRGRKDLSNSVPAATPTCRTSRPVQASDAAGDFRISQKVKATDTFIYNFVYRRVAVNPATLQVSANLIPQLSQPVARGRSGHHMVPRQRAIRARSIATRWFVHLGAGVLRDFKVWLRGKLQPHGCDQLQLLHHGASTKYVLARNTRMGFESTFGANPNIGSQSCGGVLLETQRQLQRGPRFPSACMPEARPRTGASASTIAGPRDLQTGYPVGGNAVFVNSTELRLPPFTLPYVGDNLSFVLFHDMGNVFTHVSDMFPSFTHFHQPDQQTCANLGSVAFPFGTCNFNYFSHAVGVGLALQDAGRPNPRRFQLQPQPSGLSGDYDFNGAAPYEGQAPHFNFFFSIGQAF